MVVVSCVMKDEPYMTHPNNLVGRGDCRNGVCTVRVCIYLVNSSNSGIIAANYFYS